MTIADLEVIPEEDPGEVGWMVVGIKLDCLTRDLGL